jgi:hypothetical protein
MFFCITSIYSQEDTTLTDEFKTNITDKQEKHKGDVGSFGRSLSLLTSFVSLNGYTTNEYLYHQNGKTTFDNHYFNLLASAEISKRIFAEIQMEYEHGGSLLQARYAQIDYKFNDMFIIRSGKFLVPAGEFNEYRYPEYISKTAHRTYVNEEIIPVSWGEVGVQLRGQLKFNGDSSYIKPYYALYLVNGLRGDNGGNIRNMRNNVVDTAKKVAYGGNIGTRIGKYFNMQFNYYYGDYDPTATLDLVLAGTSFSYDNNKFSIFGEYHIANQEYYPDPANPDSKKVLHKYGFYILTAYKFKTIEPVIRYDQIRLDGAQSGDRDRFTFGLNYYFYDNCVFKINYESIKNKGIDLKNDLFSLQIAIGF